MHEINVTSKAALPDAEIVCIEVCGNGFLYNMVRTLAGTLLWYSQDRLTKADLLATLNGDRGKVGKTMPAKGLVLYGVECGLKILDGGCED